MDKIHIENLEVYAHHGVFQKEKDEGQNFYVSADLDVDIRKAGLTDDLDESVDYGGAAHLITEVMQSQIFDLIERCAETVAEAVLLSNDRIRGVRIQIKKPHAPIGLPFETVYVEAKRSWHDVFLALGSNLGQSEEIIKEAVEKLGAMKDVRIIRQSTLIRTAPYGVTDQPDFLNGALRIETLKQPYELLETLHEIEAQAGRERKIHWGPRTLDLDILFYDDIIMENEDLCIPHADMKNRSFVLGPLNEIARYKVHPVYRKRVCEMLEELEGKE